MHTAIAFGEDDFRLGEQYGLNVINPVRADGTYDERIGPYEGRFVKDADPDLIADLESRGLLYRAEQYEHSYPHCWRCDTPLLYYAKRELVHPHDRAAATSCSPRTRRSTGTRSTSSTGASASGSRTTSTGRCRASATGARRCRSGAARTSHVRCIGSIAELRERRWPADARPTTCTAPTSTTSTLPCPECGGEMRRVPEVIDAWFDSGAMPFAQFHYPFENEELFKQRFPADFICEALDQTRGWFYSLLAESTLLFGTSSYKNVLCLGLILDPEGQKMSKSRGNVVAPWDVIDRHGADAFRWYYFTSQQPWSGYRFSVDTVGESVRKFLLTLWNTYGFYVLYANVDGLRPRRRRRSSRRRAPDARPLGPVAAAGHDHRRCARSSTTTTRLPPAASIATFVDDLSNWYVRRTRRRFWRSGRGERRGHARPPI